MSRRKVCALVLWAGLFFGVGFPAVAASGRCETLFFSANLVERSFDELVRLKFEIEETANASLKSVLVREFTPRYEELERRFGPDFRTRFRQKMALVRSDKLNDSEDVKRKVKKESESLLRLSELRRMREHNIRQLGPFVDDTSFVVVRDQSLIVYDHQKQEVLVEIKGAALSERSRVHLSPARDQVIVLTDDVVHVFDLKSKRFTTQVLDLPQTIWADSFLTHDGKRLLTMTERGGAMLWEVATGKKVAEFPTTRSERFTGRKMVESPDGRYIFLIRPTGEQVLWDQKLGQVIDTQKMLSEPVYQVGDAIFASDSKSMIFLNHSGSLFRYDLAKGEVQTIVPDFQGDRNSEFRLVNGYLVFTYRKQYYENRIPVRVIDLNASREMSLDFGGEAFSTIDGYRFDEQGNYLYFAGRVQEPGEAATEGLIYQLNLKNFDFQTFRYVPGQMGVLLPRLSDLNPSGRSIFYENFDGDGLVEIY